MTVCNCDVEHRNPGSVKYSSMVQRKHLYLTMQLTVKHLLVRHHIVLSRFFRLIQAELRIHKFHIQLNFISFCLRNDVYFVSSEALNSTHLLTHIYTNAEAK